MNEKTDIMDKVYTSIENSYHTHSEIHIQTQGG